MSFAGRLLAPVRRAFSDERPASLSLAAGRPSSTAEIGVSGVSSGNGRLQDTEYKYELRGRQGGLIYQRMRWSDPHIAGLRAAQNLPMMQASVKIMPYDPADADAVKKADLVDRLLLRDFPWRSFLQDTFLALDYGFACFEVVWRVEDGEARCRLALRPASSIATDDIYVKDGVIDHVVQKTFPGGEKSIPGERIVWFSHEKEGDSFQGRPILRAMYKPWKIKEELEIELPIMIRKLGGIPDITTEDQPTKEEAAALDDAGARFGLTPDAYFRHMATTQVNLLTGNANVKDVLDAIQQRNTEITSVCQAQVFDLGTSQAGSRALGTTLADLFTNGIQAQAKQREDVLNARYGIIHQLVDYNFASDDNLPYLKFGNVQQVDLRAFAQALVSFSQAFATLDPETQEWAREESGLPTDVTAQITVPEAAGLPAAVPGAPPAPATDPASSPGSTERDPDEVGAQASEPAGAHLHLAENRPRRGVECFVALAEIEARFDDGKTAIREATQVARDRLVAEVVTRAMAAQKKGKLAAFAAQAPPMVDALKADIVAALEDFYAAGREQVSEELRRQREGEPVAEEIVEARQEGGVIEAAEKPKRKLPGALGDLAEMAARELALLTMTAAAAAVARAAVGVPLEKAAIVEAVTRESDAAALRMVGVVSDVMNLGRADESKEQAQDIEMAVYSAILDGSLCENCEPMDGTETTDLDVAAAWTPNPDCLGGDRCRCITVYEIRQEAQ